MCFWRKTVFREKFTSRLKLFASSQSDNKVNGFLSETSFQPFLLHKFVFILFYFILIFFLFLIGNDRTILLLNNDIDDNSIIEIFKLACFGVALQI